VCSWERTALVSALGFTDSSLPQRASARVSVITSAKVGDSLEVFLVQARGRNK